MKYIVILVVLLSACGEAKTNTGSANCSISSKMIGAWVAGPGDGIQFNSDCTGKTTNLCGLLFTVSGVNGDNGSATVNVSQSNNNSNCLSKGKHSCVYMIQETGNAINGIETYLLFNCGNGNQVYEKLPQGDGI